MRPMGRLARVAYLVREIGQGQSVLVRTQEYLDDPLHREPWTELASTGTRAIAVTSRSAETTAITDSDLEESASPGAPSKAMKMHVPSRLHMRLLFDEGWVEKEIDLR